MNFYHALKYLRYIAFARHRKGHGVHSPFIFDIVSRVFRNKTDKDVVFSIERIRKMLISDRRSIIVNDFGSGEDKNKSKTRKVSEIARRSAVPRKYGILLSRLAAEFGKPSIVELGTSFGISTIYMSLSAPGSEVHTLEGCPECAAIARENFKTAQLNIEVHTGLFDSLLPEITGSGIKPGLIFIDGNHRKEPVLKYFVEFLSISDETTVIVIDDIYNSREMSQAWSEIKQNEKVSATIDIFRMGIVFLRQDITRNNYIIRY